MVDCVGVNLGFQTETDRVAGVKLHGGPIRSHLHNAPAGEFAHARHENDRSATAVDDEVVVVEALDGLANLIDTRADEFRGSEIQRCARHRHDLAGRNQLVIGQRIAVGVQPQFVR